MTTSPTTLPNATLPAPRTAAVSVVSRTGRREETRIVPVLTFVLWLGCLAIGVAGMVVPYSRPAPPQPEPPPVVAELLNVELTPDPMPVVSRPPQLPSVQQPPPVATAPAIPPLPEMAVAAPSPEIAFAVPIAAPARIVPVNEAAYRTVEPKPEATPAPAPVVAQPLTFGHGEGRQPAPEYPRQSLREGQEGVVTVRMTVGEDGRVLAAEAVSPSPWPLLNQAALRVVKSRWRFAPGKLRAYEVAIRFQLNR